MSCRLRGATGFVAIVVCIAIAAISGVVFDGGGHKPPTRACADPGPTLRDLQRFDAEVGTDVKCVVLFDANAPSWSAWSAPWFARSANGNTNWSRFAREGNRLILTFDLVPLPELKSNWRARGADGAYEGHARLLAENLKRAGMGHATIRLGDEANGSWATDSVGSTSAQWAQWKAFWRKSVIAMRSVPGTHFSFDWCIAAGPRAVPFAAYYPGDDVVDSIGFDVYDRLSAHGVSNRWRYLYNQPGGIRALAAFAATRHKPLAVPEWGLDPKRLLGGGSDPAFTAGLSRFIATHALAFQSYFFRGAEAATLMADPKSLAIYRHKLLR